LSASPALPNPPGTSPIRRHRPIALLIVAALLPLVLLSAALGIVSLRHQQHAIEREALGHVERISILLERELRAQIELVRALAQSTLLDMPINEAAFAELARRVRRDQPAWTAIVLSDRDGNRLLDVPEPVAGSPGGKVVDQVSHARAVQTGQAVIGPVLRGPRNRPAFAIRMPATRGGAVNHVVSAVVEPTAMHDVLFSGALPEAWMGGVIDSEGRVVARRMGPLSSVGELASASTREARVRSPSGIYEGSGPEGQPILTAYRVLPDSNWSVHIAIPRDLYLAPVQQSLWLMAGAAALTLMLVSAFLWLLGREIRLDRREKAAVADAQHLEALGRMTGGVAHDFNNLLMIMQGSAEALKRRRGDADSTARLTDAILSAAERGKAITRQLLAFARRGTHEPVSFDLGSRMADLVTLLKGSARGDIHIGVLVPEDTWPVHADPNALEVALINLAVNARDAMPAGGKLTVTARNVTLQRGRDEGTGLVGDYVAITVRDTGIGIPDEHLGRLFEPFFTTKATGKGTGLGLSQVYGFVRQSGGAVTVASTLGQGSTFTVFLPRGVHIQAQAPADETPDEKDEGGRVLLVEDNREVAQITEGMLRAAGYAVMWVKGPAAALDLVAGGEAFDIVLSDIVMEGGLSGLDLADRLHQRRPDLPILLMTGYSEALATGSSRGLRVLSKPFREAELVAALRGVRRVAGQAPPSNVIRLGR
jgi:signal transduction histidine kinase/CheY-like chemotaxis protein